MTDAEAEAVARQLFNEKNGKPISGYDPKLAKSLSVLDGPMPKLWPQFEAMKRLPCSSYAARTRTFYRRRRSKKCDSAIRR